MGVDGRRTMESSAPCAVMGFVDLLEETKARGIRLEEEASIDNFPRHVIRQIGGRRGRGDAENGGRLLSDLQPPPFLLLRKYSL